jgi:uncharacterized repeat protein (TIGR01451 family)
VVVVSRLSSFVVRPVLPRPTIVALLATVTLLPCGVARAATITSDFESPAYKLGPLDGQQGWSVPANAAEAVVPSGGIPTFGQQSWQLSNLEANSSFTGTQNYSPPVSPAAGQNLPNTVFIAKFSFYSAAYQPSLYVTVSPDSGQGSRMQWVSLESTPNGIEVWESDSPLDPQGNYFFDAWPLGVLSYGVPHTIEWRIKLNPGDNNDVVQILVDGQDTGRCFTTWENYYRQSPEQAGPPNNNMPPDINSLQFRTSQQGDPGLAMTGGFLFDNVSVTTGTGAAPVGCGVTIDKQADSPTVTAGALAGYTITARNRGHLTARDLLLCDHIPRHTTFVSADRKLRRLGRRRCLLIPRLGPGKSTSVHLDLRVNANAPQGILDNIADIGPVVPPGSPSAPVVPPLPTIPTVPDLPAGARVVPATAIKALVAKKVTAILKVIAKKAVAPPPVTG